MGKYAPIPGDGSRGAHASAVSLLELFPLSATKPTCCCRKFYKVKIPFSEQLTWFILQSHTSQIPQSPEDHFHIRASSLLPFTRREPA